MGFGLSITDNTLQEPNKKDWVEHNGIMMSKRSRAAYRRAETIRSTQKEKKKTDKEKYMTIEKENQRTIVAELLDKVCKEWDENGKSSKAATLAVILESPELLFIKKLFPGFYGLKQDIDYEVPGDIIIPNKDDFYKFPTTQRCYYYYAHHLKYSEESRDINYCVGVKPLTYLEFINEYMGHYGDLKTRENCCLIWADYCGAFSKYKVDIEKTFESKILGDNSYYILTFCVRDPTKNKSQTSKINCIVEVQDFVKQCARKYEYNVELMAKETGLYKDHMYTCFFHVVTDYIEVHRNKINTLLQDLQNYENLRAEIEKEFKIIDNLKKLDNHSE